MTSVRNTCMVCRNEKKVFCDNKVILDSKPAVKQILIQFSLSISELSEKDGWFKLDYANTFDLSLAAVSQKDNVERVDAKTVSLDEFIEKYEKPYKPCVIINSQNHWMANIKWTKEVKF